MVEPGEHLFEVRRFLTVIRHRGALADGGIIGDAAHLALRLAGIQRRDDARAQ